MVKKELKIWLIDATTYKIQLDDLLRVQENIYYRIKSVVKSRHPLFNGHTPPAEKTLSIGLLRIATILSHLGYDVSYLTFEEAKLIIDTEKSGILPDIIGFSAVTPTIKECAELSIKIKKMNKYVRICLGGPHVKFAKRTTAAQQYGKYFDDIITSDDVEAASALIKKTIDHHPNKYVDYSILRSPLNEYNINLFTSQGCHYNCQYCQDHLFPFSSKFVLDGGLSGILEKLSPKTPIHFCDCELGGNPIRAIEVCNALAKLNHNMLLSCDFRVEFLKEPLIKALTNAQFAEIRIGIDSADDRIIKFSNRNISIDKIKDTLKLLRDKSNFYLSAYLVTGLPYSNKETLTKNLSLLEELFGNKLIDEIKHHIYVPYPTDDEKSQSPDVEIIIKDWSKYDRLSYPVYKLSELTQRDIWNHFLETKKKINQFWMSANNLSFQELPEDGYSEYNRQLYLKTKNDPTYILHLSDLHFKGAFDADKKSDLKGLEIRTISDKLKQYIQILPGKPDFVAITGDFTETMPSPSQYKLVIKLIDELIQEKYLPGHNRIIVTPGNHDVKKGEKNQSQRFKDFRESIGSIFIKPWFPGLDSPKNKILEIVDQELNLNPNLLRSLRVDIKDGLPFILDLEKNILLYSFNSAYISNTTHTLSEEAQKLLNGLKVSNKSSFSEIDNLLNVDPGHIHPDELSLFNSIMQKLHYKLKDSYNNILKIAILHHQISTITRLPEIKQFETLLNAGQFKYSLKEAGFDLVLHGHKHWPETFLDTTISNGGSLVVVSGGTIEAYIAEKNQNKPGFHWLAYDSMAKTVSIKYIEILKSNPTIEEITNINPECFELPGHVGKRGLRTQVFELNALFSETNKKMIHYLEKLKSGKIGWEHSLGKKDKFVDTVGTSYGLRIMKLINSNDLRFLDKKSEIIRGLFQSRNRNGGWCNSESTSRIPRPEITAWVLDAFYNWGEKEQVDIALEDLVRMLKKEDEKFYESTFCVSLVLKVLSQFSIYEHKIKNQIQSHIYELSGLLHRSLMTESNKLSYWSEKTCRSFERIQNKPSISHTASSIIALIKAYNATNHCTSYDMLSLKPAVDWLLTQEIREDIQREEITRVEGKKQELLRICHFTKPLVVVALLEAGTSAKNPKIINYVKDILNFQDKDDPGVWSPPMEIAKPIWATYDALNALKEFSMRINILDY